MNGKNNKRGESHRGLKTEITAVRKCWLGGVSTTLPFTSPSGQPTISIVLFPSFEGFLCCVLTYCAKEHNLVQKVW